MKDFFFNDTATTEIYTLSLHDALPISRCSTQRALLGSPPNSISQNTSYNTLLYTTKQENSTLLPGDTSPAKYGMRFYSDRVLIDKDMFSGTPWHDATGSWVQDVFFLELKVANNTATYLLLTWNNNDTTEIIDDNEYFKFSYGNQAEAVCLTDTCDILTPNGYVNIKDLSVGDLVTTPEGKNVKITKVMKPTTHYAMGKAYPHFIPKNSLGKDKPTKDTFVSKNHAYKSGDIWLCGQKNSRMCVQHNTTNWDKDFVTYYNIMTEDYPKHTLVVNGVEMECWGGYENNKPETHGNVKLRREQIGFK